MAQVRSSDRRALSQRLAVRLGVALCLGAAVILLAAGVSNVLLQRQHMTNILETGANRVAEVIRSSTRRAMMANDPEAVHAILGSIGREEGIDRIRIFDKRGRITKSTDEREVGRLVDLKAEQCTVCHQAGRPLEAIAGGARTREMTAADGARLLGVIAPIRNEPDCSSAACHAHSSEQSLLGVLDVQLSLGAVDAQLLDSERQMGLGLGLSVLGVLVLAGLLVWVMVARPVRRLTEASARVGAGDLTAQVPVRSEDEIGGLSRAWNRMVGDLRQSRDQLEEWSRTLETRVAEKTAELETAHKRMLTVEKMASLGKLAAVVAHEINNPLAGIGTYARLLRRKLEKDGHEKTPEEAEAARVLELVEGESARCGRIVQNLLLFSRMPSARFAENDLRPLLERCALLVKHQAALQEVEIQLEAPPDLPRVRCDAGQIQQVILALTMNAIEAMPAGGLLRLAAQQAGESLVLEVSDTGVGIPPENLDRIFEPFFTTKEHGEEQVGGKGVGLGLAVVYGIVQRHHGNVEVTSAPGRGTTFRVRLPLHQPEPKAAANPVGEDANR